MTQKQQRLLLKQELLKDFNYESFIKDDKLIVNYHGKKIPASKIDFAHLPGTIKWIPDCIKNSNYRIKSNGYNERDNMSDLIQLCAGGMITKEELLRESKKTYPVSKRLHISIDKGRSYNEMFNRVTTGINPLGSKQYVTKVLNHLQPIFKII